MGTLKTGRITMGLVLPVVGLWKKEKCDFGESYRKIGLSLSSKIFYVKTEYYEEFSFCLLGLGFYVSSQKGFK